MRFPLFLDSEIYTHFARKTNEERKIIKDLMQLEFQSWAYHGHLFFIDNTKFGIKQKWNWINIMRNPLERQLSSIYYIHSDHLKNNLTHLNIFKCYKEGWRSCQNVPTNYQSCFFAGNIPPCHNFDTHRDKIELLEIKQTAIANIEKYFSVVGLTEHMRDFFKVARLYMPRFFNGSLAIYDRIQKRGFKNVNHSHNNKKSLLDPKVEKLMYSHSFLQIDMEVYNFVQERFHKQYNKLYN